MSAEDPIKNENVRRLINYISPALKKALEKSIFDAEDQHVVDYTMKVVNDYLYTQMDGENRAKHVDVKVQFDTNHKVKIHLKSLTPFGLIIVLDMKERFGSNIIIH